MLKYIRLVLLFVFAVSCARELKQESDLRITTDEFKQDIQSVKQESLDQIIQATPEKSAELPPPSIPAKGAEQPVAVDIPPLVSLPPPQKIKPQSKSDKKPKAEAQPTPIPGEKSFWQPAAWPFGVGEKIEWVLRYGPVEAGVASMEVLDPKVINNEPVIHYQAKVRSTKLMELIYKVNDSMSTWTGLYDHLPRRQEINQLESGRWGKRIVVFNQKESKAKFFAFTNFPDGRSEEIKREDGITPYAQDVLGALYFVRFIDPKEYTNFPIHDRWKNWANELTYLGKEKIKVPAGEYETFHYRMFPRVSGQLEPKGDVEIWVWDHPSRLLVQFSANVRVGSVVGELKSYQEGRPFTLAAPLLKTPKVLDAAQAQ